MKTFILSWVIHKTDAPTEFAHGVIKVDANNEDEAVGKIYQAIRHDYQHGWRSPAIACVELKGE